jgi:type III pantothenate kinase
MNPSKLLIDVGNSRVKWCIQSSGQLSEIQAVGHDAGAAGLEASLAEVPIPDAVLVSNVNKHDVAKSIAHRAVQLWGRTPIFAYTHSDYAGLRVAYAKPETFGVDRWLAMLGAWAGGICPAVIVDAGTAVTVDVVDSSGAHRGGIIAPGMRAMGLALLRNTGIESIDAVRPVSWLGESTGECIELGIVHAISGMVERVFCRSCVETSEAYRLLLTGGDADKLSAQLDVVHEIHPKLVLEGLGYYET